MSESLGITIVDVGWGDSILVESVDDSGTRRFGLIDCNDSQYLRSGLLFVKRYFERVGYPVYHARQLARKEGAPVSQLPHVFEWILLTHGHADHARGLKGMMQEFGTKHFWYPKSAPNTSASSLIRFARVSDHVRHHQSIDRTKVITGPNPSIGDPVAFGNVEIKVLWPDYVEDDSYDKSNENNNSVVLSLRLRNETFVTTGDAEANNWNRLPFPNEPISVFQAPHHGAYNGLFDDADSTPWLDSLGNATKVAISCHITPYGHPHPTVIQRLNQGSVETYRTDQHYHLSFETNGAATSVTYSHAH